MRKCRVGLEGVGLGGVRDRGGGLEGVGLGAVEAVGVEAVKAVRVGVGVRGVRDGGVGFEGVGLEGVGVGGVRDGGLDSRELDSKKYLIPTGIEFIPSKNSRTPDRGREGLSGHAKLWVRTEQTSLQCSSRSFVGRFQIRIVEIVGSIL